MSKEELIDKIPNTLRISVEKGMPLTESMLSTNHGTPIELEMYKEKVGELCFAFSPFYLFTFSCFL